MAVRYETPGPEHAESLLLHLAIAFEGYREFAPPGWEPPDQLTPEMVDRCRGALADPAAFALMAVYEGDPVGHVLWVPADDEAGLIHLRQLFVLEPWWGSGVADRLHAAAVGAMSMPARLFTPAAHARARRFYEKRGWRVHAEPVDVGLGMDCVDYRLDIARTLA